MTAVGSVVLTVPSRELALLPLALVLPALSIQVIKHDIKGIGNYIKTLVAPVIADASGMAAAFRYQDSVDEWDQQAYRRLIVFYGPLFVIFAAPAFLPLLATIPLIASPILWLDWAVGALLSCF